MNPARVSCAKWGLTGAGNPLFFAPEAVHLWPEYVALPGGLFRSLKSVMALERESMNEDNRWMKRQAW